jgi:hypothetical protein
MVKIRNRNTMIYKTVHRKVKIDQHRGKITYFRRLNCSCSTVYRQVININRFTVCRQVIQRHLFLPTLLVSYVALNPDSATLLSDVK